MLEYILCAKYLFIYICACMFSLVILKCLSYADSESLLFMGCVCVYVCVCVTWRSAVMRWMTQ